jgi:ABC-type sugar transport system substrate-binding protein
MTIIKRLQLAFCAALSATLLHTAGASAKELKIGMANLSLCCAYFVGMDAAVKDEAKQYPNVPVLSTNANGTSRS